jgi:predicted DNA-binding protein (MmcQ/YjbR family)
VTFIVAQPIDAGQRSLINVHLNKRHWNSIILDGMVADDEVQEWIEHSYDLVIAKLPQHRRATLGRSP